MADKKYYWLKLPKDFFKRHNIRIIKAMPNGKDYVLFYLQLLVESIDHDGMLRFSDTIPYNEDMLSTITDTNVDVVRSAIKVFCELGMMEILDDSTIFMNESQKMLGGESWSTDRVRKFREKQKSSLLDVTSSLQDVTCNEEIEKEIELDKEIDNKQSSEIRVPYTEIVSLYNSICKSFPQIKRISNDRKKAMRARFGAYSLDDFKTLFEKAESSRFLKGGGSKNFKASFDWLIKDANMAKVLDGNYDGGSAKPSVPRAYNYDDGGDSL